jgi:uncharacterized protein YeaO (DUF488 family)
MRTKTSVSVKRVYETPSKSDGVRILVDRLWPRGLSRASAKIDVWLKEVAPSAELRKQFHASSLVWRSFVAAYRRELTAPPGMDALAELQAILEEERTVTLLYGLRDERHNNAVALKRIIQAE